MHKKETIIKNQKGIASMVIVILIMTLISLIVVSMTRNANREQKQALDRQLNSQAFYAAESGINDARDYYISKSGTPEPPSDEKTDCGGVDGADESAGEQFPGYSSTVGEDVNSYSCVLYDANPESLDISELSTNKSVVWPLEDKDGDNIQSLTFTWKEPNNSEYQFHGCNNSNPARFPTSLGENCDAGALRIELIDPSGTTRSELIDRNFLAFVSPRPNPNSAPGLPAYGGGVGTSNQGVVWKGGCTGGVEEAECSLTIHGIDRENLILHLKSIYKKNEVSVTGAKAGGEAVEFEGAQMMVDATGRASDVLKRIRVKTPLSEYSTKEYPESAVQTGGGSICKLLQIIPPGIPGTSSSDGC